MPLGPSKTLRGSALMAMASVIFAAEALAIRWMTARGIPVEVQVFVRSAGQLLWVAPQIAGSGLAVFRTERIGLHLLRGAGSVLTWGLYYASFGPLDLATATVLSFTNVMFTTMLAGPVLGERVDRWRWAGTVAGLVGVAVMLRPGTTVSTIGVALALGSAVSWCVITLSSRVLAQTERNSTVMAWVGVVATAASAPFAAMAWVPLGVPDLLNTGRLLVIQGPLVPVLGRAAPGGIQDFQTARPRVTAGKRFDYTVSTLQRQTASMELTGPAVPKPFSISTSPRYPKATARSNEVSGAALTAWRMVSSAPSRSPLSWRRYESRESVATPGR